MISPMFSKWFHLKLIDYEVYCCPRVSYTQQQPYFLGQLSIKIINLWY